MICWFDITVFKSNISAVAKQMGEFVLVVKATELLTCEILFVEEPVTQNNTSYYRG
jgi:hypothetical protein